MGTTVSSTRCALGMHKYSAEVYEACVRSFESLPITALIDGKFFCVHGGISPDLLHLTDIDRVRIFRKCFYS